MVKTQKQEDTQVVETLKCSDITPDLEDQPRTYFDQDKLNALGRSIKVAGQMMPIVVKPLTGNPEYIFQLVDGERRLQASIFVGMETIRAIIRPNANFKDSVIMNLCREGHTPLEMAYVFKRLIDEFGHSVQEVADMTGRSITSVYQHLKILTLDPEVQALMDPAKHGKKAMNLTIALKLLSYDPSTRLKVAEQVVKKDLKIRQALAILSKHTGKRIKDPAHVRDPSKNYRILVNFLNRTQDDGRILNNISPEELERMFLTRRGAEVRVLLQMLDENIATMKSLKEKITEAHTKAVSVD